MAWQIATDGVQYENLRSDGGYADTDGSGSFEYKIGLVDVSNGAEKTWITSAFPVGFTLQRIRVVVHKDESLWGVNYSLKFNSFQSSSDVEFKFKFGPAIAVATGSIIKVALSMVVSTLRAAANASSLKHSVEALVERLWKRAVKRTAPLADVE